METEPLMETEAPPIKPSFEKLPFIEYEKMRINKYLYNIKIYQTEDSIIFNANLIDDFELSYEKIYTLSELYTINRFFKQYSTTKEVFKSFFQNFKKKDIIAFKEENTIHLVYKFESMKIENEIDFILITNKIKLENIIFKFSDKINKIMKEQKDMKDQILDEIKNQKERFESKEITDGENINIDNINNINDDNNIQKIIKASLKEQKKTNKNIQKDLEKFKTDLDKQRQINKKIMKELDEITKKKDIKIDKVVDIQYKNKYLQRNDCSSITQIFFDNKLLIIIFIFSLIILKGRDRIVDEIKIKLKDMKNDYRKISRNVEILKLEINKTRDFHIKDYRFIDAHLHILHSNITVFNNYIKNHLDKEIKKNRRDILNIKESLTGLSGQLCDYNERYNLSGQVKSLLTEDINKIVDSQLLEINKLNKQIDEIKEDLKIFNKEKYNNEIDNFDYYKTFINEELEKNFSKKIAEYKVLFRATRDGFTAKNFHNKCDGYNSTLTLILTNTKELLGGYAKYSWNQNNEYKKGKEGFMFSINNNIITKIKRNNIYCQKDSGPIFGDFDIVISNNSNLNYESYYNKRIFNRIIINDTNIGKNDNIKQHFSVLDYVVYQVLFKE